MSTLMPRRTFLSSIFGLLLVSQTVLAQTIAFSYQGKLTDSNTPANGQYFGNIPVMRDVVAPPKVRDDIALQSETRSGQVRASAFLSITLDDRSSIQDRAERTTQLNREGGAEPKAT